MNRFTSTLIFFLLITMMFPVFASDSTKCSNDKINGTLTISGTTIQKGRRPLLNIVRIQMRNVSNLLRIYIDRLRSGLRFSGNVAFNLGIDSKGTVVSTTVETTNISDTTFLRKLIENISSWKGDQISSLNDTTFFVYPFKFDFPAECKNGVDVIDSAAAIKIAVDAWKVAFGKELIESEKPYFAELKDSVWYVSGAPLPKGRKGGTAKAEISRQSGKILKTYHEQ